MTRRFARGAFLVLLPLVLPGCMFFGLGCGPVGGLLKFIQPDVPWCAIFSGDCCGDTDADGFGDCGSLINGFDFPCGALHDNQCACVAPLQKVVGQTLLPRFATYAVPPFTFDLSLDFAGMSAAQRVAFDVVAEGWQTFSGAVTYSPGFGFNGFIALGPAQTQIGIYGIDINNDDTIDLALPVRALTADTAYVDVNGDGQATVVDPTITHVANVPSQGAHTFNLLLPGGGDTVKTIARSFLAFRAHVVLQAGILRNPNTPGPYSIAATFTSVDPDTGDASDGMGQSPFTAVVPLQDVVIEPSPLALLDHFLCYKTKPSKGNICAAAAAVNVGVLCASDADCGGTVGACVKNKLASQQVTLADEFDGLTPRTVDVKKALHLCTPADKNAEGCHDTVTHLRGYQIAAAKGTSKSVPQTSLRVVNQLGTLVVDTKAESTLMIPAAKALAAPAAPLGANVVDHYECYKATTHAKRCAESPAQACKKDADCGVHGPCLGKFPKGLQVTVADQFTASPKRFDVKKPTRLCNPALMNGGPIESPDGHLMCYQVKTAKGEPKHVSVVGTIHTTSELGRERLDTTVEDELCIPSLLVTVR